MNDCICIENSIYIKIGKENVRKLKVACIFDEFTMKCYDKIIELISIKPDNWKRQMKEDKPDIFFVESIWAGEDDSWRDKILLSKTNKYMIIKDIINWCNENNITTIFWNKEDPVYYNFFIKIAKLFDYVFTTDENSLDRYKKDLSHDRVFTLPFAANPKIHNPIKYNEEKINKSFFAGTYYRNKYEERKVDLKKLLNLAIEYSGLDIYDRHYNSNNPLYYFPKIYGPYIKGYLKVDDMYKTYKKYKIALNVNTIKNSPTMFSRRVFECLASGVPIISSYSLGINKIFGGLVISSDNINELKEEFINLGDEKYYYDKVIRGIREVTSKHTYKDRLMFILKKIGTNVICENHTLGVIGKIKSFDEYKLLKNQYLNQTYKYKKLYIFTENESLKDIDKEDDVNIVILDEHTKQEKIENLLKVDYIGCLDINNIYGSFYFEDLINASAYADADIIGKKSFYKLENNKEKLINEDMDFRYVDDIDFDKCIIKKEVLFNKSIDNLLEYINHNKIFDVNCKLFSSDKSNLIVTQK